MDKDRNPAILFVVGWIKELNAKSGRFVMNRRTGWQYPSLSDPAGRRYVRDTSIRPFFPQR